MPEQIPKWLVHDGTEAGMARVLNRMAAREYRLRHTMPTPHPAPNITRLPRLGPSGARFTRQAWAGLYPDSCRAWWKPWPHEAEERAAALAQAAASFGMWKPSAAALTHPGGQQWQVEFLAWLKARRSS